MAVLGGEITGRGEGVDEFRRERGGYPTMGFGEGGRWEGGWTRAGDDVVERKGPVATKGEAGEMGEEDGPAFFEGGIKFSQLGLIRSPFAICSGATGGCEVGRGDVPDRGIAADGDGDGVRVFG